MKQILKLFLLIVIIAAGLLCVSHIFLMHSNFNSSQHHYGLIIWRYACYALVLIMWPYAVKFIGTCNNWHEETVLYFSNQRLKVLVLFILIECFFVYNIVGRLFSVL